MSTFKLNICHETGLETGLAISSYIRGKHIFFLLKKMKDKRVVIFTSNVVLLFMFTFSGVVQCICL